MLLQPFGFQEKLHPARSPTAGHSLLIFTSTYINILLRGKPPQQCGSVVWNSTGKSQTIPYSLCKDKPVALGGGHVH